MHALHAPLRCEHIPAVPTSRSQHFQALGHPLQSCPAFLLPDSQLEVAPQAIIGKRGRVEGQILGVFCADPRAWGAFFWKDSSRTKACWTCGELLG